MTDTISNADILALRKAIKSMTEDLRALEVKRTALLSQFGASVKLAPEPIPFYLAEDVLKFARERQVLERELKNFLKSYEERHAKIDKSAKQTEDSLNIILARRDYRELGDKIVKLEAYLDEQEEKLKETEDAWRKSMREERKKK